MLRREFEYYIENQPELVNKYNGKFIVIKDRKVIDSFDSHSDAYNTASKRYELGTFLIQHCLAGKESYSQTFHSQVIIHAAI